MRFNSKKVAFGRHETFPLRYSWLSAGFQKFKTNPKVFTSENATVELGVGKNMVYSIRFWLQACQVLKYNKEALEPTEIGEAIFGANGLDPYLEDEATIWLLHWLLSTNPEIATTFFWFFNRYHKGEFTEKELVDALKTFSEEDTSSKVPAIATLKNDIAVLIRMYTPPKRNHKIPFEETLNSPMSVLRLISFLPTQRKHSSKQVSRMTFPVRILGFAIAQLMRNSASAIIPVETLMSRKDGFPAIGSVFRLSEDCLLSQIEKLVKIYPDNFELRESAGIHQLYEKTDLEPMEILNDHYQANDIQGAA